MKKEKAFKRILATLLPIALVFCSLQVGGIERVEAKETTTKTITVTELEETPRGDGYYYDKEGSRLGLGDYYDPENIYDNYILVLDKDFEVVYIDCCANLTVTSDGNHSLNMYKDEKTHYVVELDLNGHDLTLNSGVTLNYNAQDYSIQAGNINVNGARVSAFRDDYIPVFEAKNGITLSGGSYIKKPEGGKIGNVNYVTILDADGKGAAEVEIDVKAVTPEPEKAADETPAKEEEKSSDSSKKSYKNEWVNGQWYDANGKTSYKYKGGWKVNATGWWYEDENGWFPTNMWQKIDGDWYFFHEDGYMAENEYAGKWAAYSEGYWWVGSDGRWDGSEPGVWRLVGTKWWFKDSTGWYAKAKWYKIGGKWYEFDNDGWWIEPE